MAGVTKIWIDQSEFSEGEKLYCLDDVNVCYVKKSIEIGQLLSLDMALIFPRTKIYNSEKSEKYQTFCVSKLIKW